MEAGFRISFTAAAAAAARVLPSSIDASKTSSTTGPPPFDDGVCGAMLTCFPETLNQITGANGSTENEDMHHHSRGYFWLDESK